MTDVKLHYERQIKRLADAPVRGPAPEEWGDTRDGSVYVVDPELRLAVEIALAIGRPLLLRGEPGSGKSSLAAYVARNLSARYYELVVTSRTEARDVLWSFDAIRKLSDAQGRSRGDPSLNDYDYVEPGVLWWVLNRATAIRRGAPSEVSIKSEAEEPNSVINSGRRAEAAVVLIDEIDKADPDIPNGLLVPIGSSEFMVQETRTPVRPSEKPRVDQLLIVITTNETRELPDAFVRRCVVRYLEHPDVNKLVEIAAHHAKRWHPPPSPEDPKLFRRIAERLMALREEAGRNGTRPPSTAEYLDAVRACRSLLVDVDSPLWEHIESVSLRKTRSENNSSAAANTEAG